MDFTFMASQGALRRKSLLAFVTVKRHVTECIYLVKRKRKKAKTTRANERK